ncbi:MAG: hypothetical protein RLZ98_3281 [Pseudomonadota bacterium]|jgi:putative membrane protein
MTASAPRRPRVFSPDDPKLKSLHEPAAEPSGDADRADTSVEAAADPAIEQRQTATDRLTRASRWGAILISALASLFLLSLGLWFWNFVWAAFQRSDWLGWLAMTLLAVAAVAALAIVLREVAGLLHIRSLHKIRALAERARATGDRAAERTATRRLTGLLAGREDLAWPLARFREHTRDVRDAGDLLTIAERELLAPLDRQAQRCVLDSARRVSIVTAVSPASVLSVVYVLYENLRMLRALATLYGGRPGFAGSLRLARMVFLHILATGGIALTDDLLGQFIGQDLLRRLSRRLGEGVFNGALTARVGVAAIAVVRPLPFIEAKPPRIRALLAEVFRNREKPSDGR